jgi:TatD DNase family protein
VTRLHDTHCHIDLQRDPVAVIERTEAAGVYTLAMTNVPSVFFATKQLLAGRRFLRPALGLHPELVATHGHEIGLFEELLEETRYIGEVGLDYPRGTSHQRAAQRQVFARVLELAAGKGDRILSVHSRGAANDVVEMVGAGFAGQVILHWYSGGMNTLERALENGLWISVNPAMLVSKRSRSWIEWLPRERVLVETDGPFVEVEGAHAEPRHAADVVAGLAELWKLDQNEVERVLGANFRRLLEAASTPLPS